MGLLNEGFCFDVTEKQSWVLHDSHVGSFSGAPWVPQKMNRSNISNTKPWLSGSFYWLWCWGIIITGRWAERRQTEKKGWVGWVGSACIVQQPMGEVPATNEAGFLFMWPYYLDSGSWTRFFLGVGLYTWWPSLLPLTTLYNSCFLCIFCGSVAHQIEICWNRMLIIMFQV